MIFNTWRPIEHQINIPTGLEKDFPTDDWKYADIEYVYDKTDSRLVQAIIEQIPPLSFERKRRLIDVKVQDLTPDFVSCIPGWHLDGALPRDDIQDDWHYLFILNGPGTEFISDPIWLDWSEDREAMKKQIPEDIPFFAIEPAILYEFSARHWHRGVRAKEPTRRLLIRVTDTNTILPINKPTKPGKGARK